MVIGLSISWVSSVGSPSGDAASSKFVSLSLFLDTRKRRRMGAREYHEDMDTKGPEASGMQGALGDTGCTYMRHTYPELKS